MSGPVLGINNLGTAWGTAIGVLVSWEPFDFGLRRANVTVASALQAESEASLKRTEYEVAVATADACLTLAAAQETIRAAQAGVDRAAVLLRTITALVNAQLRPGADASRADAELAAARTQWIQAQQAADVARATLAQFVGIEPAQIALDVSHLLQLPPEQDLPAARHRQEPDRDRAERRRRRDSRQAPRSRTLLFSTLLSAGHRLRARLRRRDQRQHPRRPQRTRAQRAELRPRLHRDLPHRRPALPPRPRGRSVRHHPRAAGQVPTDRHRPASPVESRRRHAERRAPRRRQHARRGGSGAHRRLGRRPRATKPASATSPKSPTRSACSPNPRSTTPWPASPSGAASSPWPPPPATFNPSSPRSPGNHTCASSWQP